MSAQCYPNVCSCPSGHSLHSQACDHSCDQHPGCPQSPVVVDLSKELHLGPGLLEALACLALCQLLSFWQSVPSMPFGAASLETSCVICQLIPDSFAHWGRHWRLQKEEVKTGCFLLVSFLWPLAHQILWHLLPIETVDPVCALLSTLDHMCYCMLNRDTATASRWPSSRCPDSRPMEPH